MEKKLSEYISLAKNINISKNEKKIKIGVLGSFTLNGLDECLKVKCSELNIDYESYIGNYNQYNQEILDSESGLYKFEPDITFLIIDNRTILGDLFYHPYSISDKRRKEIVDEKFNEIKNLVELFEKGINKKLVICNFHVPYFSSIGMIENKSDFGFHEMIYELNKRLVNFVKDKNSIFVFDYNQFVVKHGEKNVFDYKQFFLGDIKIAFDYIPFFANDLMGYIKPVLGLNKKCIVLDLDNTLWGGIVGEEGFDGIEIGHSANGKAFVEFQKQLLSLWQQGIILAINSKNNFDDAIKVIKEHPDMVLREKHFASIKINWNDKAQNLVDISKEINIGLNSMVFFDDDKLNQERIKNEFPEVLTIELPKDPSQYAGILTDLNDFNVLQNTEEDSKRGEMYAQQRQRNQFKETVSNLEEFLNQLKIKVKIKKSNEFTIPRISQLTLKTNQFNLTTRRYQEEDIKKFVNNDNYLVGCAQVSDKFGDNGITGAYIIKKEKDVWTLDTFLLSCRVMGRGVENAILSYIIDDAKNNNVKEVKAEFIHTAKNKPAENFLKDFGFNRHENYWNYKLNNDIKYPDHLEVEIE